jgi:hypothetical protein
MASWFELCHDASLKGCIFATNSLAELLWDEKRMKEYRNSKKKFWCYVIFNQRSIRNALKGTALHTVNLGLRTSRGGRGDEFAGGTCTVESYSRLYLALCISLWKVEGGVGIGV